MLKNNNIKNDFLKIKKKKIYFFQNLQKKIEN